MRRRMLWREVCLPKRAASLAPPATGGEPDGGDLLAVSDGGSSPWLDTVWEPRGFDFARTVRIAAGKFANRQDQLDTTACAGDILQSSARVAMDR
jgi:hypothetical protein